METSRTGKQPRRQSKKPTPGGRDCAQRIRHVQPTVETTEPTPVRANQVEGETWTDGAAEEGRTLVNTPRPHAGGARDEIGRAHSGTALSTSGTKADRE